MRIALALPLLALLAACGFAEPEPVETPTATSTAIGLRTLVATELDEQLLGPKIVGPQGDEVSDTLTFEGQAIADIVSYVACPVNPQPDLGQPTPVASESEDVADFTEVCLPDMQPEGAIYTYVHRVTPVEGAESPILSFRTARPANGFANNLGFDRAQAEAALGEGYEIGVQIDNGALIWRIEAGNGWDAGEEITFFWQGTLPPAGPEEAYEVETSLGRAAGTGPFPPPEVAEETGDTSVTKGAAD